MERLKQAAQVGNIIDGLYACILKDKEALKWIDKAELVDSPLHIAAREGQVEFAMAMMNLKPSCGRKLNKDIYSPTNIAFAVQNGFSEVDKELVRVKGKEGYTALHSAA